MTEHNDVSLSESEIALLQRDVLTPALKANKEQEDLQAKLALVEKIQAEKQQTEQEIQNRIKSAEEFITDKTASALFQKMYDLNKYDMAELVNDLKDEYTADEITAYLNNKIDQNDIKGHHSSKYGSNRGKFHRDVAKGIDKLRQEKQQANTETTTQEEQKIEKTGIRSNKQPDQVSTYSSSSYDVDNPVERFNEQRLKTQEILKKIKHY